MGTWVGLEEGGEVEEGAEAKRTETAEVAEDRAEAA